MTHYAWILGHLLIQFEASDGDSLSDYTDMYIFGGVRANLSVKQRNYVYKQVFDLEVGR